MQGGRWDTAPHATEEVSMETIHSHSHRSGCADPDVTAPTRSVIVGDRTHV